jgi:hypothetical protein
MRALAICGVAALIASAQQTEPELVLLNRIKAHMRSELTQVPNYTCLETVRRLHSEPGPKTRLTPLDSVHLEIVYSGGKEWYGMPGDRSFTEKNPAAFIGTGMIGDGLFAITLHNLFVADAALFTPQGEESLEGRRAMRYDFRLPRSVNKLAITLVEAKGTVGEEGSLWVDPESLDLLRLDVRATEIPAYLPLSELQFQVTYGRTRIGELDGLLAQQADLSMTKTSGSEDFDRFDFTHCRTFHTASTIHFGGDAPVPGATGISSSAGDQPRIQIPALLAVTIALATPISDRDAVGKLLEGRVVGSVKNKGQILIDDGALVTGRLRRLDRYKNGPQFILGIEFTEVRARAGTAPFYADLLSMEHRPDVYPSLEENIVRLDGVVGRREIQLTELPGVVAFFVKANSFPLAPGLRTVWRTRGLLRGVN